MSEAQERSNSTSPADAAVEAATHAPASSTIGAAAPVQKAPTYIEFSEKGREALIARRRRTQKVSLLCALTLLVLIVVNILLGQYMVSPGRVAEILLGGPGQGEVDANVVWAVRLPRIALALSVGAALGTAGALMQALFANPLAEPGVIGVSSGAAVGAAVAIISGAGSSVVISVPLAAFVTGLCTTLLVYHLARARGQARALALVLTGVAVNAVAGAATSFGMYIAPSSARDQIVFWQMGSLNGAQWYQVALVAPLVALSVAFSIWLAPRLDLLALGERAAAQVGLDTGRLRFQVVVLTALLTAAAVAYAGIISFVGLIVPHVLRLVVGPRNRVLVPLSALCGALLVLVADLAARTLVAYADLPIGIFTALVGGPTFFVLLRRMLRKGDYA